MNTELFVLFEKDKHALRLWHAGPTSARDEESHQQLQVLGNGHSGFPDRINAISTGVTKLDIAPVRVVMVFAREMIRARTGAVEVYSPRRSRLDLISVRIVLRARATKQATLLCTTYYETPR